MYTRPEVLPIPNQLMLEWSQTRSLLPTGLPPDGVNAVETLMETVYQQGYNDGYQRANLAMHVRREHGVTQPHVGDEVMVPPYGTGALTVEDDRVVVHLHEGQN